MFDKLRLTDGVEMRLLLESDATALAAAYVRNRGHLLEWEPTRPEEYYTVAWQDDDIATRLAASESGEAHSVGLFAGETVVGRFNLAGIVRGPFQSAGLGYWVDGQYTRRGLATAAVREIARFARDDLELHRIEASTLVHNIGSQRVLHAAGFRQIGMAPRYLQIAGSWQDHNLYQAILHD